MPACRVDAPQPEAEVRRNLVLFGGVPDVGHEAAEAGPLARQCRFIRVMDSQNGEEQLACSSRGGA